MKTASVITVLTLLATASFVVAQEFAIDWYTVDGGGAIFSTGGGYDLAGTIGQPDAQTPPVMSGGTFELTGGFWPVSQICNCPGDMNGDAFKDGLDIQRFVGCFLAAPNCSCADVDGADGVSLADVAVFVDDLLTGSSCP